MGKTDRARFEAFARGVADGGSIRAAATAAGYGVGSNACYRMARTAPFKAEVIRVASELRHASSNSLAPIIAALMEGAHKALAKNSNASLIIAARMLAEAGRLKQRLPPPRPGRHSRRRFDDLTLDEWLERYGADS
ncbi:MAG TPA: hypothetical protein VIJ59_11055 [Caulobacteraceae bacterium]